MTFLHGAACAVFCFGPPLAIYKGTGVSDQSGTRRLLCIAVVSYFLNLVAKSLLVASFFPATCESWLACSVMIDAVTVAMEVITIRYLLFHKTFLSYAAETRVLCIGLGWAMGHLIYSNGNLLSRAVASIGFSWMGVYFSLQASLILLCYLSATGVAFISSRRHMTRVSQITLLVMASLLVPWTLLQKHLLGLAEPQRRFLSDEVTPTCWCYLALHAVLALLAGFATYTSFVAGQRQQAQKNE